MARTKLTSRMQTPQVTKAMKTSGAMTPLVMREIKKYQASADLLLPTRPFQRLVKELAKDLNPTVEFKPEAIKVLQIMAEEYLASLFDEARKKAVHVGRKILQIQDMQLVLRGRDECGSAKVPTTS